MLKTIQCPVCVGLKTIRRSWTAERDTCPECSGEGFIPSPIAEGTLTQECFYCKNIDDDGMRPGSSVNLHFCLCKGTKCIPIFGLSLERTDEAFLNQAIIARRRMLEEDKDSEEQLTPAVVQDALFEYLRIKFYELTDGCGLDALEDETFYSALSRNEGETP